MKWKLSIIILQICYLKIVKPKVNPRVSLVTNALHLEWGRKDGEEGAVNSLPSRVLDKLFRTVKLYLDKSLKNFCER